VVTGKLVKALVEVDDPLPVKYDLDGPEAKAAVGFPQVHLCWLPTGKKLHELCLRCPATVKYSDGSKKE
jgi:hypothetical protein